MWFSVQDKSDLHITTVSEAELLYGVAIMPEGKRRTALAEAMKKMLREDFGHALCLSTVLPLRNMRQLPPNSARRGVPSVSLIAR